MRCSELVPLLADYANGQADERGRRIVERHIRLCAACREDTMRAGLLGQQLARVPLLPIGIADRLPRLRRDLEQQLHRRKRMLIVFRITVVLMLVVCVACLLFLVVRNF